MPKTIGLNIPTKVYILVDLTTPAWAIRYVGKTVRYNLQKYFERVHVGGSKQLDSFGRYKSNRGVNVWLREISFQAAIIEIATYPTEHEAFQAEEEYIALLKESGCNLTNISQGGEGPSGFKWSDESKERLSKSVIGHLVTPETREKLRQAKLGKLNTLEQNKNIGIGVSGEKNGMFGRRGKDCPTYGRKRSIEEIAKTSGEKNGMFGRPSPNKGRIDTKETKEKKSLAKTQWHREHPDAMRGDNNPSYWKGKQSWNHGRSLTEEQRGHCSTAASIRILRQKCQRESYGVFAFV
jgi:hypothetical protein